MFSALRDGWLALVSVAIAILQLISALIKYFRRTD